MMLFWELGREAVLQGLIFSLVVMAVYLSSRVIRCDDLSVEGSFGMGGAAMVFFLGSGMNPWLTLCAGMVAGACVGMTTGILHTKLKINHLIAGIIATTAVYSINLKLGGANKSLMDSPTVFDSLRDLGGAGELAFLLALSLAVFFCIKKLLQTEVGMLMRAAGCNPAMMAQLGKDVDFYKVGTLVCANALTGLAGGVFVQYASFYSITGSMGTLVMGLTGLILAEIVARSFSLALIGGAIVCQAFFAFTIALGVDPVWNYLIKAGLIIVFLQLNRTQPMIWQRS